MKFIKYLHRFITCYPAKKKKKTAKTGQKLKRILCVFEKKTKTSTCRYFLHTFLVQYLFGCKRTTFHWNRALVRQIKSLTVNWGTDTATAPREPILGAAHWSAKLSFIPKNLETSRRTCTVVWNRKIRMNFLHPFFSPSDSTMRLQWEKLYLDSFSIFLLLFIELSCGKVNIGVEISSDISELLCNLSSTLLSETKCWWTYN